MMKKKLAVAISNTAVMFTMVFVSTVASPWWVNKPEIPQELLQK